MASNDNQPAPADNMSRNRRSSVTSATLSSIFRSNSTSSAVNGTPIFPSPITSAALDQNRRRRLSISTTAALGLGNQASAAGGSLSAGPAAAGAAAFGARRASTSTSSSASDAAVDENAIEDDDAAPGGQRATPNSPFSRRMSFGAQAMRTLRGPGVSSPGGASSNDQGYSWPEQFRSRAESTVASGSRPSFSFASGMGGSPPRASGFGSVAGLGGGGGGGGGVGNGGGVGTGAPSRHDRAKSVSDVPTPAPAQQAPRPRREARPKPDHFQERILKGDFYMD